MHCPTNDLPTRRTSAFLRDRHKFGQASANGPAQGRLALEDPFRSMEQVIKYRWRLHELQGVLANESEIQVWNQSQKQSPHLPGSRTNSV